MAAAGFDDFDFLVGDWTITNDVLKHRLAGSDAWDRFSATSRIEKVMAGPDGVYGGNLEQMWIPERGFTGMTLRLYDPETALWSIYWSDTRSHRLFPPTIGKFIDGKGEFFGDDTEGGTPVRVRFSWTAGERPRWQQEFSADQGQSWELNWVMTFDQR